jgi:hypothetical protein
MPVSRETERKDKLQSSPSAWRSWRNQVFLVLVIFIVESAGHTVIGDLPHWFLWATIPLGAGTIALFHFGKHLGVLNRLSWVVGIAWCALVLIAGYNGLFESALAASIDTTSLFYRPDKHQVPMESAIVLLHNNGSYDTGAHDFWLIVQWPNGELTRVKSGILRDKVVVPYTNGRQEILDPKDDLNQKAFDPIHTGNEVRGRLIFQSWSVDPDRQIRDKPVLEIEGTDDHGKRLAARITTVGASVINPPYGEYPGIERRFLN